MTQTALVLSRKSSCHFNLNFRKKWWWGKDEVALLLSLPGQTFEVKASHPSPWGF
jgi:hypothetical protein